MTWQGRWWVVVGLAGTLLAADRGEAQIVDTLGGWNDDAAGWSGRLGVTGSVSGGNTDVQSLSSAARAQWRGAPWRVRVLGSFRLEEANDVRSREESLGHVRVARVDDSAGESAWAPFAFGQAQRNPLRRLETRLLAGAGVEWVARRTEGTRISVGASPMLEYERVVDEGEETRGRLSTFVQATSNVSADLTLSLQGFYQPRLNRASDYRTSLTGTARTRIAGPLSFLARATWERDDDPPSGVEPDDWEVSLGATVDL